MTKVYTRLGDDGTTGMLFGGRVSKASRIVSAYGTVDEAVAVLGVARSICGNGRLAELVFQLERELFVVAADLAANPKRRVDLQPGVSLVTREMVAGLEATIDRLVAEHPLQPTFVVPGTTQCSAVLDLARTVLRRAERLTVEAESHGDVISKDVRVYLNRASDLIYVLARVAAAGVPESPSHD